MYKSLFLYLIIATPPAIAGNSYNLSLDLLYFDYQEFNSAGYNLNHETGYIPGLSGTFNHGHHEVKFSIHDGIVNYDGYTQALTPHTTHTHETIYRASYRYNFEADPDIKQLHYFIGLGHQFWLRRILTNNGVLGLDETYTWLQLEAGIQTILFKNTNNALLFEFNLLHTLNSKIKIDLQDIGFGSPELDLGNKPGIHSKLMWQVNTNKTQQVELGIDFSYWSFDKSNSKTLNNGLQTITIEEPRSESSYTFLYIGLNHQF